MSENVYCGIETHILFVNNWQLSVTNIVSSNAQDIYIYNIVHIHTKFRENSKFSFKLYDSLNTSACLILHNNKRRGVTNLTSITTSEVFCCMTSGIPISNYETCISPLHSSLDKVINGDLSISSNLQI